MHTAPTMAAPERVTDRDGSVSEVWPLPTDEDTLWMLLQDVFGNWWQHIHFGVCVPGAVYEIKAPNAPQRMSLLDGYATIDFGPWHLHLCIGTFKGVTPELAHERCTGRAELYRLLDRNGAPRSWGLRLFTHAGHQQLTVFLPNPFLTDEQKRLNPPDWGRLQAWNELRSGYLNLPPDPADQSGKGFVCGG